ncbi:putative cell cycle control protein [Saccharata proteae CBS 121410]|uniref:Putative cell cycle control protein n=1 Tax=Saccharata proteae CBS 121410 TaxID=1314787 RepID=A0A6A5YDM2_9PEZI|nr:putative cell cycle control protein [Saccharata proteae CBS 121410]
MGLEDFERELAESQAQEVPKKRHRSRSRDREHRHSKRSRRDKENDRNDEERSSRRHKHRTHHSRSPDREEGRDEWVEKEAMAAPATEDTLDNRIADLQSASRKRDSWMEAPSSLDVDYVQKRKEPKPSTTKASEKDYQLKIHENELNHHLRDLQEGRTNTEEALEEPAEHEVDYTFGDDGAQWRMTKLKAVYRQAEESGRPVDDVALERFGDLRAFDDAREEEIELDRRKTYGRDYVGKEKPSGELFQERKQKAGVRRQSREENIPDLPQGQVMEELPPPVRTHVLDQTALNKLKAQMMKAKLRGASDAAKLEAVYNEAMAAAANRKDPSVVVLSTMENRMLAGRQGEVTAIENKRGRERGLVKENEDMSIEDMVKQEKRTRGQQGGEGLLLAERIAKDAKFDNDLDYIDDNADRLAKHVQKSTVNLRNTAISDYHKMNRVLDSCPLCHHENSDTPPIAPVVSLATRVYLTLPTEPEISEGGACIVPIQHRTNLLECDEDEWEEIRNFMKSLTRMYHDQGRDVVFYENAAAPNRKLHAAMQVVPLPYSLGETAPAFFREAILAADEEWTQHKKLIDTAKRAREGLGKLAFRRSLAKEMPYFHAWFELDGGLGHVVEDANRWPKGDLFAREVLGGMLDVGPEVVKRQGRWQRGDRRVEGFRKRWRKFDWTRVLTDG